MGDAGGDFWIADDIELLAIKSLNAVEDAAAVGAVDAGRIGEKEDGIAGARADLAAMPSVDIANGAPTGADATDEIVDAWTDGSLGPNDEVTMVSYSTDLGATWSSPSPVSLAGDRSAYSAPAIAPDGTTAYVVYMAYGAPFQATTSSWLIGVGTNCNP